MTLRRAVAGLAIVFALGALGLVCQRVAARGRYAAAYSTYGAGPDGARALLLLTGELGFPAVRWVQDIANLPTSSTLVALAGCDSTSARELGRTEGHELDRFVRSGGMLVVAGARGYLPDSLGVSLRPRSGECKPLFGFVRELEQRARRGRHHDAGQDEPEDAGVVPRDAAEPSVPDAGIDPDGEGMLSDDSADEDDDPFGEPSPGTSADPASPFDLQGLARELSKNNQPENRAKVARAADAMFAGVGDVMLDEPGVVRVDRSVRARTLLAFESGEPAAVEVRVGRGTVVVFSSASLLQNRALASHGGVIFERLLRAHGRRGPVLFDEYHLGVGEQRSLMQYVGELGFGALALQLVIMAVLFLWRRGGTFGAPVLEADPLPDGTEAYVSAVAQLYEKARDSAATLAAVKRHAVRRIAAFHKIAAHDPEELSRALAERRATDASEAVRALMAVDTNVTPSELVSTSDAIDALVARATRSTDKET